MFWSWFILPWINRKGGKIAVIKARITGMAGVMEKMEFSRLRVLLLARKTHAAQTLRAVMAMAGITRIALVEDNRYALELLSRNEFDAVFCDDANGGYNGLTFPQAVRASSSIRNPMMPVFVFRDQAWRKSVEKARDTGATDFLTCPVSPKTVMDKLTAALAHPRPFIKAPSFFGPDRRGRDPMSFLGEDRRRRAPKKVTVTRKGTEIADLESGPATV